MSAYIITSSAEGGGPARAFKQLDQKTLENVENSCNLLTTWSQRLRRMPAGGWRTATARRCCWRAVGAHHRVLARPRPHGAHPRRDRDECPSARAAREHAQLLLQTGGAQGHGPGDGRDRGDGGATQR